MNQTAFGKVAKVSQATICRWERGEFEPGRDNLEHIRSAALERGLEWEDALFFVAPRMVPSKGEPAPAPEPAEAAE